MSLSHINQNVIYVKMRFTCNHHQTIVLNAHGKNSSLFMTCNHTKRIWNPKAHCVDYWEDEWKGGWEEQSTFEDIDLHHYKCTKCGEVGYYSGRAQAHYEEGKPFWDD